MGFNCDFNFCLNYKISSLSACLRLNHVTLFIVYKGIILSVDISSHSLNLQLQMSHFLYLISPLKSQTK